MKTYPIKFSSSLILIFFSFSVLAAPVGQIVQITGSVFSVDPLGKTTLLKMNQHIEDGSQVMVEEGASVTINDYYDASYSLIGGSHVKFYDKSIVLQNGKVWIKSSNVRHLLSVRTANSQTNFYQGEYIISFDQMSSRSSSLAINGEAKISSTLNEDFIEAISPGTFSLVDPEINGGTPRPATRIGLESLNMALAEFSKLPENNSIKDQTSRSVASINEEKLEPKKGEIKFITTFERAPASVGSGEAHNYFKKVVSKKKVSKKEKLTVRIFGVTPVALEKTQVPKADNSNREPASVPIIKLPEAKKMGIELRSEPEFVDSLKKHQEEQPKHTKELQNLIDELKSF